MLHYHRIDVIINIFAKEKTLSKLYEKKNIFVDRSFKKK
jgi:hypothetical protein